MLYCTILYYTILYYAILCYTILYYTILYYTILFISLFNKFTCENLKNLKKQEAGRKPVSFIARHLGYLDFQYFQLTSRNLVSLVAIIHIVCTQFLPKKQHFLPPDMETYIYVSGGY